MRRLRTVSVRNRRIEPVDDVAVTPPGLNGAMFERELAAIARRQHGLILYDQARAAGLSRRMIE